ncbi:MAG: hypothetical protein GWN46_12880, partial [Gammaproteobacteria bacterium]|nr:hypothetical protein [Gammaproteobacteria bacterium]
MTCPSLRYQAQRLTDSRRWWAGRSGAERQRRDRSGSTGDAGTTRRWQPARAGVAPVAGGDQCFLFSASHGLGFAGALTEIGLPAKAVPLALLFFNVGVETGQLLFVAVCLILSAVASRAAIP